jgi:hypothetical protein
MMVKLKLPKTLRLARLDEAPKNESILESIKASENNNIVEGYRLKNNPNLGYPYKFFAEINVDNDRLWSLFSKMMLSMPDYISLITSRKDDEISDAVYGDYQDKYELYNKIEKYERELTLDGFLQFGVIHQTKDYLEEIFVHNAKYIQYWGMDMDRFKRVMKDYSLYEVDNLEFIDSYPMVTKALFTFDPDVLQTEEILNQLRAEV